ncbi:MAG: hypothetical protein SFY80_16310 [Verrucomicrobiota bacterium]|nr:hypothetical protein [Verrucomicrobiota bacterium]
MAYRSPRTRFRRYWINRILLICGLFVGGFLVVVLISPQARKVVGMILRGEKAQAPSALLPKEPEEPLQIKDILAKHYEATGGYERQVNLTSLKLIAKLKRADETIDDIAIFKKAPNLIRTTTTLKNGRIVMAYDGKEVWRQIINRQGSVVALDTVDQKVADDFIRDAPINSVLFEYEKLEASVELMGEEVFESQLCYKVRVTSKSGLVTDYFLDTKEFLERGTKMNLTVGDKVILKESKSTGYKEFDGLKVPGEIKIYTDGKWQTSLLIETMEPNGGLLRDLFMRPNPPQATAAVGGS